MDNVTQNELQKRWNTILLRKGLAVTHVGDDCHALSNVTIKRIKSRQKRHLNRMKRVALEHRGGVRTPSVDSTVRLDPWENEPLGVVGFGPNARSEAQAEGLNPGPAPQAEKAGDS